MKLTITFSAMLSLCQFGDHVLFSGSTVMTLVFQGSYSQISYDFFFHPTNWPTQNQETYSTLNERKGDDLSLTVSFWASSTHCVCVFLYTYLLLCFVLFLSVKKNETVPRPFEDSRARVRKWKTQWFIDRKGQKEKWQWTGYSRLDIEHLLWWDLSPLPVHGVDSRCWWQFRDAVYVTGTCFTRTFPQLRSPLPPCQPCEKWCTSK